MARLIIHFCVEASSELFAFSRWIASFSEFSISVSSNDKSMSQTGVGLSLVTIA